MPTLPEPVRAELDTPPRRRWRAWLFQAYLVAALLGFAVLLVLASSTAYFPIDLVITRAVQGFQPAWFTPLMRWVSFPGFSPQVYVLTAAVALALFGLGLRWEALCALLAAGASGAGVVFKLLVHRPRPSADLVSVIEQLDSFSFPSGHVLYYTAFVGFLLFLAYSLLRPSWRRALLMVALAGPVLSIGLSRIELGQHWFSDVAGAYLLGSVWLMLTIQVYRWGKERFFTRRA
jgi:membrane-associated phospholipid phosphatase